jgi:hypothetical protein
MTADRSRILYILLRIYGIFANEKAFLVANFIDHNVFSLINSFEFYSFLFEHHSYYL